MPNEKNSGCEKVQNVKANYANVSIAKIADFIRPLKDEMCKVVKPGAIKVALAVDAEGKVFGVGLGTSGSIEFNFECK